MWLYNSHSAHTWWAKHHTWCMVSMVTVPASPLSVTPDKQDGMDVVILYLHPKWKGWLSKCCYNHTSHLTLTFSLQLRHDEHQSDPFNDIGTGVGWSGSAVRVWGGVLWLRWIPGVPWLQLQSEASDMSDTNLLVKCRFFYNRLTGPRQWRVPPWLPPAITEPQDRDSQPHHHYQLGTTSTATTTTLTAAHGNNKQQHRDQTGDSSLPGKLPRQMDLLGLTGI